MDADGIDSAVLYPTTPGLSFVPDPERWGVVCRAYNEWLEQYCSAAPDRLVGVGLVPLQDPPAAVKEHVGADRIIWASDYPHPDAKIPGVVAELDEAIESLTAEQQRLIRGGTAAALYDL